MGKATPIDLTLSDEDTQSTQLKPILKFTSKHQEKIWVHADTGKVYTKNVDEGRFINIKTKNGRIIQGDLLQKNDQLVKLEFISKERSALRRRKKIWVHSGTDKIYTKNVDESRLINVKMKNGCIIQGDLRQENGRLVGLEFISKARNSQRQRREVWVYSGTSIVYAEDVDENQLINSKKKNGYIVLGDLLQEDGQTVCLELIPKQAQLQREKLYIHERAVKNQAIITNQSNGSIMQEGLKQLAKKTIYELEFVPLFWENNEDRMVYVHRLAPDSLAHYFLADLLNNQAMELGCPGIHFVALTADNENRVIIEASEYTRWQLFLEEYKKLQNCKKRTIAGYRPSQNKSSSSKSQEIDLTNLSSEDESTDGFFQTSSVSNDSLPNENQRKDTASDELAFLESELFETIFEDISNVNISNFLNTENGHEDLSQLLPSLLNPVEYPVENESARGTFSTGNNTWDCPAEYGGLSGSQEMNFTNSNNELASLGNSSFTNASTASTASTASNEDICDFLNAENGHEDLSQLLPSLLNPAEYPVENESARGASSAGNNTWECPAEYGGLSGAQEMNFTNSSNESAPLGNSSFTNVSNEYNRAGQSESAENKDRLDELFREYEYRLFVRSSTDFSQHLEANSPNNNTANRRSTYSHRLFPPNPEGRPSSNKNIMSNTSSQMQDGKRHQNTNSSEEESNKRMKLAFLIN